MPHSHTVDQRKAPWERNTEQQQPLDSKTNINANQDDCKTRNATKYCIAKQGPDKSNRYTMVCPSVRGDNPRALASGLSYVQADKHGIPILYHLHQCRPCTERGISC